MIAISSVFSNSASESLAMERTSELGKTRHVVGDSASAKLALTNPMSRGDLTMHQSAKCVRCSAMVRPGFPTLDGTKVQLET